MVVEVVVLLVLVTTDDGLLLVVLEELVVDVTDVPEITERSLLPEFATYVVPVEGTYVIASGAIPTVTLLI